jgi:hypothetical protein
VSGLRRSQFLESLKEPNGDTDCKAVVEFIEEEGKYRNEETAREQWALSRWYRSPDLCSKDNL